MVTSVTLIRCHSSDNHKYKHAYLCVCIYIYTYICLIAFLSIPDSCLPNSLFELDTGDFNCPTTSCRPCQPTFLPGFHRFGECACFSWVSTEYCNLKASGYTDVHVQTSRRRCDGVFSPHNVKHTHLNTDVIYIYIYMYVCMYVCIYIYI